jgi:hypothetical protein
MEEEPMEPMKTAKDGIAIVGEIIKAAGDNPQVREAGINLGQTALIITKTINNALLPLAAVNFAFDKARDYFAGKFASDISAKAAPIPVECIIEPKASIAGPALQGLAFTHEEPDLRNMYLSILATAMDSRNAPNAHPAFVEVIKQLTSDEARLLQSVLSNGMRRLTIAEIRSHIVGETSWSVLQTHLLDLRSAISHEPSEDPRIAAMVDNWVRLGLVGVDYTTVVADERAYDWVESRPEYKRFQQQIDNSRDTLTFQRGTLRTTSLGVQFAHAVGLTPT